MCLEMGKCIGLRFTKFCVVICVIITTIMADLTVTKYNSIDIFLKETESYLQQYELKNTFILVTAYQILKEKKEGKNATFYCGAIWNDKLELIFVILGQDNACLYASCLFDATRSEAIDLLTKDVLESSLNLQGLHGYQPVLNLVRDSIETKSAMTFVKEFSALSYELKQVKWSSKIKEIAEAGSTSLRLASESDLDILHKWTFGFIQDAFENPKVITQSVESISQDMITSKGLYILCIDGIPVSMAWKVRPLRHGASLAYVYTPNEHRNKGYGAVCVAMTSEAILRDYSYITLFVDIKRNPDDNLYTRVGYKYAGEAGRLERLT